MVKKKSEVDPSRGNWLVGQGSWGAVLDLPGGWQHMANTPIPQEPWPANQLLLLTLKGELKKKG